MPETWPFDQAPNVAAITTRQVLEDRLPVLRAIHYSDDHSWAFVCGTTNKTEDIRVIGMGEALELDPSLRTIADLQPGWTGGKALAVNGKGTRMTTNRDNHPAPDKVHLWSEEM